LTDNQVKKVSVQGGAAKTLCDAQTPVQAWWHESDVFYFSESEGYFLSRVSADGGKPSAVISAVDQLYAAVQAPAKVTDVLPGGQSLIVTAERGLSNDYSDIYVVTVAGLKVKRIIQSGYGGRFVPPDYIVFARSGSLLAARFNLSKVALEGEPV